MERQHWSIMVFRLRKALHEELLDPLWQNATFDRSELYKELSDLLGKEAHVSKMCEVEIKKCADYLKEKNKCNFPCYECKYYVADRLNIPVCTKNVSRKETYRCEEFSSSKNI